ncbi:glycosyltransferase [Flavobacterium aquidurense]|uniref:Glycosyl transferase, group 2 family protein n=1 Tax=Flavobacterium aquidurense TaxID=362413 RepID=A0A0N8VNA0_9FLAO|nr:glycosyltransferase [Flavobacterium aquidurense]KQB41540.1 Glycosyl transferase, group 2 family protein [Flavobacterium aquidurense]
MEILKYNAKYSQVESLLLFENSIKNDILVSIIIPTYNRIDLLKEAIKSVVSQQNKELISYEIIVMDNNPESIKNLDVKNLDIDFNGHNFRYYVNSENIGMMANWNRGIELAKGKWIIQLHDDDYFLPNFIETVSKDILRFEKKDAIIHSTFFHDKRKTSTINLNFKKKTYYRLNSLHVVCGNYHISGALIKKDIVYKLGGFDPEMYPISDYDFNQKLISNFNAIMIENDPLAVIIFEKNETLNPKAFTNWFGLERIIKNNAILHLNKPFRLILSKIIDVQINSEIEFYAKEIFIEKEDQNFIRSKELKVNKLMKIIWKFYIKYFHLMNLVIKKDY